MANRENKFRTQKYCDITDNNAKVTVEGNATFIAADQVVLNDLAGEQLKVTGGTASFVSLGGGKIARRVVVRRLGEIALQAFR